MPRNVRPAWMTARATGRASTVALGPSGRSGELSATLTIRREGAVAPLLDITAGGSQSHDDLAYLHVRLRQPTTIVMPDGREIDLPADALLTYAGPM